MCGIVGYVGKRDVTPVLVEGLHRLEYRGYDSAGLAVISRGRLQITKTAGRVQDLRDKLAARQAASTAKATIGIGHTRWATHGEPNETNAHPHTDAAQPHRGRPQRHHRERRAAPRPAPGDRRAFRQRHRHRGARAHDRGRARGRRGRDPRRRGHPHAARVEGAYGLVVIDTKHPDQLVVARNGSPLVLGLGENEMFVASDVSALVRYTRQVIYLEDGEVATIKATDYHTTTLTAGQDSDGKDATAARRRPRSTPTPTTTSSASSATTCARRSTSSRTPSGGRCAAASRSGSPPPGSAASTWTPASCATSRTSSSSAAAPPTTPARWAPPWSRSWPASRPTPSPPASSATAPRSSTRTRSTSRSPSPARRSTR